MYISIFYSIFALFVGSDVSAAPYASYKHEARLFPNSGLTAEKPTPPLCRLMVHSQSQFDKTIKSAVEFLVVQTAQFHRLYDGAQLILSWDEKKFSHSGILADFTVTPTYDTNNCARELYLVVGLTNSRNDYVIYDTVKQLAGEGDLKLLKQDGFRTSKLEIRPVFLLEEALKPIVESIFTNVARGDQLVSFWDLNGLESFGPGSAVIRLAVREKPMIPVYLASKHPNRDFNVVMGKANPHDNYVVYNDTRIVARKGDPLVFGNHRKLCELVIQPQDYFDKALIPLVEFVILDVAQNSHMTGRGDIRLKISSWKHAEEYFCKDDTKPMRFIVAPIETHCVPTLEVFMTRRNPHDNYVFYRKYDNIEVASKGNIYAKDNNGPPTYALGIYLHDYVIPAVDPPIDKSIQELVDYAATKYNLFKESRHYFTSRFQITPDPSSRDSSKPTHVTILSCKQKNSAPLCLTPSFDVVMSRKNPLNNYIIKDLRPDQAAREYREGDPYK